MKLSKKNKAFLINYFLDQAAAKKKKSHIKNITMTKPKEDKTNG